jgi:hypothetical protein
MTTFVAPVIGLSYLLKTRYMEKVFNQTEAESKDKHGVQDPMLELTITSPNVHSRVDCNTFTMGNPLPESTLTLRQSRLYPLVTDFGFGLRV